MREMDQLHELYESAPRGAARERSDAVPFHKFAELVTNQVSQLRSSDSSRGGVPGDGEGREGQLYGPRAQGGEQGMKWQGLEAKPGTRRAPGREGSRFW